jgi:hypothetical protein
MKRREFFKKAGAGSAALASLSGLAHLAGKPALADDHEGEGMGFRFVCVSQAGTLAGVVHRINMNGCGTFSGASVNGGGSYNHFDNAAPVPKTLLSAGNWKAERVLSFDSVGTYGVLTAGILELNVTLLQQLPWRAVIPATLKVACSIGAGGLDSGQLEGFTLTIPGAPFGPFQPILLAPGVTQGITIFTNAAGEDEG